ncbi:MAG: hypothetical protein Tsb0019_06800 [Roseibium sp.]
MDRGLGSDALDILAVIQKRDRVCTVQAERGAGCGQAGHDVDFISGDCRAERAESRERCGGEDQFSKHVFSFRLIDDAPAA